MPTAQPRRAPISIQELAQFRGYLMRVARARLNDESRAEDAVQETLLAALRAATPFRGQSAYRTWLTSILLHKIHDGFRLATREQSLFTDARGGLDADDDDFDEHGEWRHPPSPWPDPERLLESKQFRAAFAHGLSRLPPRQAQAFVLREVEGLDSPEICRKLGITTTNLFVLLHRARLGLRETLERSGFAAVSLR